jgi:tRNA(Ile)-lysidine synthase
MPGEVGATLAELPACAALRFAQALDLLVPEGRIGLAVSGGPDSLALLLLAAAARPGQVEAATVNHGLRAQADAEAAMVARVCGGLRVPHVAMAADVPSGSSLQAQAREARYRALGDWAAERGLVAVATAHHADDQAETVLMRLARGSGLGGLAGIRRSRALSKDVRLVRPLLDWRKRELVALVAAAGLGAVDDPSNRSQRHDRTRARELLAAAPWLDPGRLGRSASALAEVQEALDWSAAGLAKERVTGNEHGLSVEADGLPGEYQRRLLLTAMATLGASLPDGPGTDKALEVLRSGGTCTLSGLKLRGGQPWRLTREGPRRS